ncbi:hypothetical protein V8G54_027848 [Vigna mungo]|uniref:Uncharacterized protein n=1 Tax=Vigna mungo TaxID=3915 RepID=A0AAQ3RK21_VIGMU
MLLTFSSRSSCFSSNETFPKSSTRAPFVISHSFTEPEVSFVRTCLLSSKTAFCTIAGIPGIVNVGCLYTGTGVDSSNDTLAFESDKFPVSRELSLWKIFRGLRPSAFHL